MKKGFIVFSIILLILILSAGIIDSLSALTNDIIVHSWLNLVGRWQSFENNNYEIEFHPDGTFSEYYHGVKKGSGDYQVHDNDLVLDYDASSCRRDARTSCSVRMQFKFELETLILINGEGRMSYNRVGDH